MGVAACSSKVGHIKNGKRMGLSTPNERIREAEQSCMPCQLNDDFPVLDMTSQHSTIKMLARDNSRASKKQKKEVCAAIRLTACS